MERGRFQTEWREKTWCGVRVRVRVRVSFQTEWREEDLELGLRLGLASRPSRERRPGAERRCAIGQWREKTCAIGQWREKTCAIGQPTRGVDGR
eukprot:4366642-Prymnesium_polylepis.1